MTNDIREILAYFEKYVKITDMHDSEPMLNWKDLDIILKQEEEIITLELSNRIYSSINKYRKEKEKNDNNV